MWITKKALLKINYAMLTRNRHLRLKHEWLSLMYIYFKQWSFMNENNFR